jgi:hypothetical protein
MVETVFEAKEWAWRITPLIPPAPFLVVNVMPIPWLS